MLNPLRLLSGYDRLPEFQEQMRLMDVEREDMPLGGCVCVCVFGFFVCVYTICGMICWFGHVWTLVWTSFCYLLFEMFERKSMRFLGTKWTPMKSYHL